MSVPRMIALNLALLLSFFLFLNNNSNLASFSAHGRAICWNACARRRGRARPPRRRHRPAVRRGAPALQQEERTSKQLAPRRITGQVGARTDSRHHGDRCRCPLPLLTVCGQQLQRQQSFASCSRRSVSISSCLA